MILFIIFLVICTLIILVLFKHTDHIRQFMAWFDILTKSTNLLTETNNDIDRDLTTLVEAVHDNLEALSLQFGELKKLFLLGNTSLELKEIIKAQPERIFDGNAFVQKFLHRAKRLAEKYKAKKAEKKKFRSLYSKSLVEPDHTRGELLEEHH